MRAVVQRVSRAEVSVGTKTAGKIGPGLLVFLGVGKGDAETDAEYLAEKIANLRIFEDEAGKMNLAIPEVGGQVAVGQVLVISQFTLFADVRRGNRPSFDGAAAPDHARKLYEHFVQCLADKGMTVETGRFLAKMDVELVNDGPVTILIDSKKLF